MINMISAAKLTKFSKQREVPPENFQTDTKQKDFASFLNSPSSQAKKPAHKSKPDKADREPDEMRTEQDNQEIIGSIISTETQKIPLMQPVESQNLTAANPNISVDDKASAAPVHEALQKDSSPQKFDPALFAKAEALIRKGIESGKIEILESPKNEKTFASQNDFSFAGKGDFADHLPKLFGEVSNLLKNENSAQLKSSDSLSELGLDVNFSDKSQTADQIKLNSADGNALNFYQPETEKLKAEKPLESTTDFSSIGFNKVLDSVAKEQKLSDATAPEVPVKPGEVLEQVEAKLIRLVNLDKSESEKKVMKMRLHPAELGAVEVRLEKNSDGKLHAYFQTESETTKQILTENLAQLRDSLHKSGWQIEHLEISCSSFSSTENGSRENDSRQFETAENYPTSKTVSGNSADMTDDSKQNSSNRLLSVRA